MTAATRHSRERWAPSGAAAGVAVPIPDQASEPGWLRVARRRAAAWVEAKGFPDTGHEDWRYTRMDAALAVPLASSTVAAVGDAQVPVSPDDLPGPYLGGARFVVVNGRVVPGLSSPGNELPAGVRVEALGDALRRLDGRLERPWLWRAGGYPHALRALNDAAALDGVVIDLPLGTVVEEPIEVVLVSVPAGTPGWSHPRVVVLAGPGSSATLVETYLDAPGGPTVTNALTQVDLGAGAEIEHYVLQAGTTSSFHFSSLEARLANSSRLASRLLATGGRIGRHEVDVVLAGKGAEVGLDGLFVTGSGQHHDNPVLVEHAAASCTSRQLYKGVVSGDGHGVFNGHIVVRPGADGTDAAQVNKNLLLSEQAEVDTRPRLEINADDVACSHGAAVGQLDADALFYLRSRGIPESEARAVLISGFAREILERFGPSPVRQRAEQLATAAGLIALDGRSLGDGALAPVATDSRRGGPAQ